MAVRAGKLNFVTVRWVVLSVVVTTSPFALSRRSTNLTAWPSSFTTAWTATGRHATGLVARAARRDRRVRRMPHTPPEKDVETGIQRVNGRRLSVVT
jgi:hypothetical protein